MLKDLKRSLKTIPTVRHLVHSWHYVFNPNKEIVLQSMVARASRCVDRPLFIKVGANDGVSGDPFGTSLLDFQKWSGVLVEPVPYCADRLRKIYTDHLRFAIDTCAVGPTRGKASFFYVSEFAAQSLPDTPEWYDQLGSFDRNHISKHWEGKLDPFIESLDVDVKPLTEILHEHNISHVTLLHVDTEGFDLEVLKSLGLPALCPSWILIEYKHLSAEDKSEMLSILLRAEYDVFDTKHDFFAMHRRAKDGLNKSGRIGRMFSRTGLPVAQ